MLLCQLKCSSLNRTASKIGLTPSSKFMSVTCMFCSVGVYSIVYLQIPHRRHYLVQQELSHFCKVDSLKLGNSKTDRDLAVSDNVVFISTYNNYNTRMLCCSDVNTVWQTLAPNWYDVYTDHLECGHMNNPSTTGCTQYI